MFVNFMFVKKLPRRLIIFLALVLIFITTIVFMVFKITFFSSYIEIIEKNWDINVIGDCTCIYNNHSGFLEGELYYIFEYDDSISFNGLALHDEISGVFPQTIDDILEKMEIPADIKPKWGQITASATIYGTNHDERNRLFLLVSSSEKVFYIIESIT